MKKTISLEEQIAKKEMEIAEGSIKMAILAFRINNGRAVAEMLRASLTLINIKLHYLSIAADLLDRNEGSQPSRLDDISEEVMLALITLKKDIAAIATHYPLLRLEDRLVLARMRGVFDSAFFQDISIKDIEALEGVIYE